MRTGRIGMRWLGTALLALTGCHGPEQLKPPLREEYVLPPSDDPRFSSAPTYPKETLDTATFKRDPPKPGDQMRPAGGFGAGPGMGRY